MVCICIFTLIYKWWATHFSFNHLSNELSLWLHSKCLNYLIANRIEYQFQSVLLFGMQWFCCPIHRHEIIGSLLLGIMSGKFYSFISIPQCLPKWWSNRTYYMIAQWLSISCCNWLHRVTCVIFILHTGDLSLDSHYNI